MLKEELIKHKSSNDEKEIQNIVYDIGQQFEFELKSWFGLLYEVLLGQSQGPRIGSFFILFGLENVIKLIDEKVS